VFRLPYQLPLLHIMAKFRSHATAQRPRDPRHGEGFALLVSDDSRVHAAVAKVPPRKACRHFEDDVRLCTWQAAADSLNLSIAWDIDEATAHLCGEHVSTPAIIMIDGGACSFASVQKPAMKSLQHCFRDRVYKAQLQ
jgi:hypothetical protein